MNIVNWFLAHRVVLGGAVVAFIDFVWAVAPNLKSSGIIHAVYDFIKNRVSPAPAA